jgi:hypothetical protein
MARILKTDGTLHDLKGTDPKGRLTLRQMQQAVGGDVHVVKLSGDKMQMVILLDVDSSLKPVRINHVATEMYRRNTGYMGEVIGGDVILCEYRSLR